MPLCMMNIWRRYDMDAKDIECLLRNNQILYINKCGKNEAGKELVTITYRLNRFEHCAKVVFADDFKSAFKEVRGYSVKW